MSVTATSATHAPAHLFRRLGVATTLAAVVVAVTATAASAHVSVRSDNTAAGGYAQLTFRVPNESADAGTTTIEVALPSDTPFASVRTKPMTGWTAKVTEGDLPAPVEVNGTTLTKAARSVTWTADSGSQIEPDQYQEFQLSVGPLPEKTGELALPTTQTYSDGEVVEWAEPIPESGEEPEPPAPAFEVTEAVEDGHGGTHDATEDDEEQAVQAEAPILQMDGTADNVARWLAGGGLLAGLAALGLTVAGRRRAGGAA